MTLKYSLVSNPGKIIFWFVEIFNSKLIRILILENLFAIDEKTAQLRLKNPIPDQGKTDYNLIIKVLD